MKRRCSFACQWLDWIHAYIGPARINCFGTEADTGDRLALVISPVGAVWLCMKHTEQVLGRQKFRPMIRQAA